MLGNNIVFVIADSDLGSIQPGPAGNREAWLRVLSRCQFEGSNVLYIDRRHGDVAPKLVESYCYAASRSGKIPILLGGDHSLTYYAYQGVKQSSLQAIGFIYFDAHHDMWKSENVSNYSFVRHLANEGVELESLGRREEYPADYIRHSKVPRNRSAYVSIDVDVLNPKVFPAVSFPVNQKPDDVTYDVGWLLDRFATLSKQHVILAVDIMEWTSNIYAVSSEKILVDLLTSIVEMLSVSPATSSGRVYNDTSSVRQSAL